MILDSEPQTLNIVQTVKLPAFMVFLASIDQSTQTEAPQQLQKDSEQPVCSYSDLSLVNNGVYQTFNKLQKAFNQACSSPQWVPVSPLGLLSLQIRKTTARPFPVFGTPSPSALRQRGSPLQELCVSLQLYTIIVSRPVGVSFVQTPEMLGCGFPDTWDFIDQDFKRVSGN